MSAAATAAWNRGSAGRLRPLRIHGEPGTAAATAETAAGAQEGGNSHEQHGAASLARGRNSEGEAGSMGALLCWARHHWPGSKGALPCCAPWVSIRCACPSAASARLDHGARANRRACLARLPAVAAAAGGGNYSATLAAVAGSSLHGSPFLNAPGNSTTSHEQQAAEAAAAAAAAAGANLKAAIAANTARLP
jgi:hypothetical protein